MSTLAIDAGQSHFSSRFGGGAPRRHDDLAVTARLTGAHAAAALVAAVARIAAEHRGAERIAVGVSGYVHDENALHAATAGISHATGASEVVLASDVLTSYLGALGAQPGAVAALGSGAIVLALGPDAAYAVVDGWGPTLGDDGSGYSVGRDGLRAVLRHVDGRGPWSELVERARARFGPVEALAEVVAATATPTALVASFAADVAACARAGDAEARALWRAAGGAVAASLAAARRRAATPDAAPNALTGGLTRAGDVLLEPLTAALDTRVAVQEDAALQGAARLLEPHADALPPTLHFRLAEA